VIGANPANSCGSCRHFGLDALSLIERAAPVGLATLEATAGGLAWDAVDNAATYDLVSGSLGLLRATGGNFAHASTSCAAEDHAGLEIDLPLTPAPGEGLFFLLRGAHCENGSFDSGGPGQVAPRDATIEAAPGSCS
jgi:hypothetical protein